VEKWYGNPTNQELIPAAEQFLQDVL